VKWAAAAGGVGGGTGSTDNSILRSDGTGGSTLQDSALVIDDAVVTFTGITGNASTDIITVTGSAFTNGQRVRFSALTGGAGLNTTTNYFVINASGTSFQLSTTEGGSFVNFTTNITAGTLLTDHSVQTNVTIQNVSGETNSALVLRAKGAGALIFGPKPDGALAGGNARGLGAVDFGGDRNLAAQVASGDFSFVAGRRNTASGAYTACVGGTTNTAGSGANAACFGGSLNAATAADSSVVGGIGALADRATIFAQGGGTFSASGDAQRIRYILRCKTTTDSAVEMFAGITSVNNRLTVPSGKVMAMLVNITGVKSDGSAVAHYVRQYAIKNVAGTTTEVYAPVTIGTDNAAGTSILLEPNDTNDALKISCTGIASETWRWVASVDAVEVAYGT
jgi:hypothetical protein